MKIEDVDDLEEGETYYVVDLAQSMPRYFERKMSYDNDDVWDVEFVERGLAYTTKEECLEVADKLEEFLSNLQNN